VVVVLDIAHLVHLVLHPIALKFFSRLSTSTKHNLYSMLTLKNYYDNRHGFLRIENDIIGEYNTI
jgi:hypothetical protein